jgi:hypothetical protein
MATHPESSAPAVSASRQLATFIARFDPGIRRLIRASRSALRSAYPTAIELVYDNYNALAIGFCSTPRQSDCLVSVAAYARGVNLYFYYGASLPDPDHRLEGGGRQGRFIRVESAATLREPAVRALLRTAAREARTPLLRAGKGRLIIQSISPGRRPRRAQQRSRLDVPPARKLPRT